MCGVAGIVRFDGGAVDAARLTAMRDTLEHRGPDGADVWISGRAGLAHRRLSIIDLEGSPQPMESGDGRWVLSFNGEIYNYRQLRRETRYPYRTDGDTEVLLATLAVRGLPGLVHVHGQFAFAAYDTLEEVLWLGRDRMGILPLYYHLGGGEIVFASEIKALLAALPAAPPVDTASLEGYLTTRSVSAPFTLFEGVRKLEAGYVLRVGPDGSSSSHRYWSPPTFDEQLSVSPAEAVDLVERGLHDAVAACMVADVPVGAYLSGGVDSSLIVALMRRLTDAPLETFSAGFGDDRFDELPFARRVSELVGTHHHEVAVRPGDFERLWRPLTWHRDAPISEPADIAVAQLARLARQHVKVALSGEGSDELFAGYPKYRFARLISAADLLPGAVRRPLAVAGERVLGGRAPRLRVAVRAAGAASPEERMRTWFAPFTAPERLRLLGPLPRRPTAPEPGDGQGDLVRRMLLGDCGTWLTDNLLERGDRMSMSASLETRPPFLERDLVDLAFRLPSDVKVRHGVGKWVVKEVARRHLPAEIVDRHKTGFKVPLDAWFRGGLRTMAWDLLDSPSSFVGSTLDRAAVREVLSRHDSGRGNEEMRIWTLLCLEVWHQVFYTEVPRELSSLSQR